MKVEYTSSAEVAFADAPARVQKAFLKQASFLVENLRHPSLRAKKYDEGDLWQARVDRAWRFYFLIQGDTYLITDIVPHPKK